MLKKRYEDEDLQKLHPMEKLKKYYLTATNMRSLGMEEAQPAGLVIEKASG